MDRTGRCASRASPPLSTERSHDPPLPHPSSLALRFCLWRCLLAVHRPVRCLGMGSADVSGVPAWARVGAKMVCISIDAPRSAPPSGSRWSNDQRALLRVGEIYTIRQIKRNSHTGGLGACLQEVVRPILTSDAGIEQPYGLWRFRPLITIEDDLEAHFTILLRQPVSIKEPAL